MGGWVLRAGTAAWLSVATATFAGAALGQPGQATNAEAVALFNEARALMDEGRFDVACPKLEQSQQMDPGMGTLFNLAHCYEMTGRLASAWAGFKDAAALADEAKRPERAQVARKRAALLEPRLSKLRIRLSSEAAALDGIEVQRNGVTVSTPLWGKDVPVDPGKYIVTASASGRRPFNIVVLVEKPGDVVDVEVPALPPLERGPAAASAVVRSTPAPDQAPAETRSLAPAFALGGVALASIGAGVAMFLVSTGHLNQARDITRGISDERGNCQDDPHESCGELGSELSTVETLDGLSFGAFAVGGLAIAGAVAYLVWPASATKSPASRPHAFVAPVVGRGALGLVVSSSF